LAPSLTLSGSAGYLSQDVETDRSIEIGGLSRNAAADYTIDGVFFNAELAWDHAISTNYSAGLFASVTGGDYDGEGFAEGGAGSMSLASNGANYSRASWRVG